MNLTTPALFILFVAAASRVQGQGGDRPLPYTVRANCAAFSPDGKTVLVGFGHEKSGEEKTPGWDIQLFDVESGKHLRTFGRHTGDVLFVQFFPDGKRFLSSGMDCRLRIWDVEKGEQIVSFPGIPSRESSLLPDGKRLLLVSTSLQSWDVVEGKLLKDYKEEVKPPVVSLNLTPDGKLALLGHAPASAIRFADPTLLRLWDVEKEAVIRKLDPKKHSFGRPSAFSDDSKLAVSTRWDYLANKVHSIVWEVSSGKELKVFAPVGVSPMNYHLSCRSNRMTLAATQGVLASWNLETGEELWSMKSREQFEFFVFSPDGGIGLSGWGRDRYVTGLDLILWDTKNGRRLRNLRPKLEEAPRPPPLKEP